jgi:hypothetical protein
MTENLDKFLLSALERFKNGEATTDDLQVISQALASEKIEIIPSRGSNHIVQSGGVDFGESNEIRVSGSVIGSQSISGFSAEQVLEILDLKAKKENNKSRLIFGIITAIAIIVVGYFGLRGPIEAALEMIRVTPTPIVNYTTESPHLTVLPSQSPSIKTTIPSPTSAISIVCTPTSVSELSPQSIAIIEPLKGMQTHVPLETLRYKNLTGLNLASGIFVEFNRMRSFELLNPSSEYFDADVSITFLDCRIHNDVIKSESGSFLTGDTEFGSLNLHILEVKRVEFEE